MLEAKRLAGRVTGACSHSVPIYVPCQECVTKQLFGWEQSIREECFRTQTDEMKRAKEDAERFKAEMERALRGREALLQTIEGLRKQKEELAQSLRDTRHIVEGMRAQLHASQAAAQGSILLKNVVRE